MNVHSIVDGLTPAECNTNLNAVASAPARDVLLVGHNRDHNLRRAELVWLDEVDGMGWVMERRIDVARTSNRNWFDFDLREFAESPQVASYDASDSGHFTWHSDIGDGPTASKRKLTLVAQLCKPVSYDGGDLQVMPGAHIIAANRTQGSITMFPKFSSASSDATDTRDPPFADSLGTRSQVSIDRNCDGVLSRLTN